MTHNVCPLFTTTRLALMTIWDDYDLLPRAKYAAVMMPRRQRVARNIRWRFCFDAAAALRISASVATGFRFNRAAIEKLLQHAKR